MCCGHLPSTRGELSHRATKDLPHSERGSWGCPSGLFIPGPILLHRPQRWGPSALVGGADPTASGEQSVAAKDTQRARAEPRGGWIWRTQALLPPLRSSCKPSWTSEHPGGSAFGCLAFVEGGNERAHLQGLLLTTVRSLPPRSVGTLACLTEEATGAGGQARRAPGTEDGCRQTRLVQRGAGRLDYKLQESRDHALTSPRRRAHSQHAGKT